MVGRTTCDGVKPYLVNKKPKSKNEKPDIIPDNS